MEHIQKQPHGIDTRRAMIRAFGAALSVAGVSAFQAPKPPAEPDPKLWNKVYSEEQWRVTTKPNRFLADVVENRKPGRALDIGIGQGRNALFLAQLGWDVTGVDIAEEGIAVARKRAGELGLKLTTIVQDFGAFDAGTDRWDLIVGMYMHGLLLAHSAKIAQAVKPGGLFVVEGFHRDIGRQALTGGRIGYEPNVLLQSFLPLLRIVRYEEVSGEPDWSSNGTAVPLVRMLAMKEQAHG